MELLPVDLEILRMLPDAGLKVGPHHLAETVTNMRRRDELMLTPAQLNGRMRSLKRHGLAIDVPVIPIGSRGWQRTLAASRLLNEGGKK